MTSPLVLSRPILSDEPDRRELLAWTHDGTLSPNWKLGTVPLPPHSASQTGAGYDVGYYGWLTLPSLPPGTYPLDAGRGPELSVTVVAPPKRRPATANSVPTLKAALNGPADIILAPGTYVLDQIVTLPANTILRCDGVTFRRADTGANVSNWAMFAPGDNVSVYGATFVHDKSPGQVFYSGTVPLSSGLVLADCTFRRCNLGFFLKNAFIRDCSFVDAGAVICPHGLYLRCRFTGCLQDPWQWCYTQDWTPTAQVDCEYVNTTRGRTFNTAGDLTDFLAVGTTYSGINRVGGGCEMDLVEGGGVFRRPVFLHTRSVGCVGSLYQFDHSADSIYVRDLYCDGGQGIVLRPDVGVAGFVCRDFELRNAGIWCGAKATARFVDGSIFSFSTGRHNSNFQQAGPVDLGRTTACYSESPASTLERVRIEVLAGYTPMAGFTVRPVP